MDSSIQQNESGSALPRIGVNNHGDDQEHPQTRRKELGKKSHGQPSSSPESTTDNVPHTERSSERKTETQKRQDQERSSQKCIAILVICVVLLTVAATVFALLYLTGASRGSYITAPSGKPQFVGPLGIDFSLTVNKTFTDDYNNPSSLKYNSLQYIIMLTMNDIFLNSDLGRVYSGTEVHGFSKGSVIANTSVYFFEASVDARTATDPATVLGLFVDDVEEIVQNGISQKDCCFGVSIIDVSVREATSGPPTATVRVSKPSTYFTTDVTVSEPSVDQTGVSTPGIFTDQPLIPNTTSSASESITTNQVSENSSANGYKTEFVSTTEVTCGIDEFQCPDGVCLKSHLECDQFPNCADGSDEGTSCLEGLCSMNEFECLSGGECIPTVNVCDHLPHCADESDEDDCYNGPVCRGRGHTLLLLHNQTSTITSPRFPLPYTQYEECYWNIAGPTDTHILLDVHHAGIPIPDALVVREIHGVNSTRAVMTFLDDLGLGLRMAFPSQRIQLYFVSTFITHGTGFNISIRAVHGKEYIKCDAGPYVYIETEICDDKWNCPDGTDERDCVCGTDEIRCRNGICSENKNPLCNGIAECRDLSDEGLNCSEVNCVDILHSACREILPYDSTYFPNDHADTVTDAYIQYDTLPFSTSLSCDETTKMAACMLLFPACSRFAAAVPQSVCRDFCKARLAQCSLSQQGAMQFTCDSLPADVGLSTTLECAYPEEDLLLTGSCGRRPASTSLVSLLSRIIGGNETNVTQWPWIASLSTEDSEHTCGATLISNRWLITAAHCVGSFSSVVLGSSSIFMEQPGRLEVQVEKILPHPFYDDASLDNDIALIKLSSRVPFSGTIQPVCLNAERDETSIFKRCYAAGWGLTSPQGSISFTLKDVELPLISNEDCQFRSSSPHIVSTNQLCAGVDEGGKDTCQGDSGGPLVCLGSDDRWRLVGVTSSGSPTCGEPVSPGVYTRISQYLDFIKHTTW
ncbi:uncharacterized protein [Asterias amurensis]|uniref:uncharacterized protein n=1 Tax=Asterias amurensis TaxID=7602 RepID=UPI003AB4831C